MITKYHSAMENITVTPQMKERILANLSKGENTEQNNKKSAHVIWLRYGAAFAACAAILCVLLLNPSLSNLFRENQPMRSPNPSNTFLGNTAQPSPSQTKAPVTPDISENPVTQPGNEAAVPSAGHSKGNAASSGTLHTQTPSVSGGSAAAAAPEGTPLQTPGGTDNPNGVQVTCPIVEVKGINELKAALPFKLFIPEKLPSGYKISGTAVLSGDLAQIIYTDGSGEITYRMAKSAENPAENISGDYTDYKESSEIKAGDQTATLKGENSLVSLAFFTKDGFSYSLSFSSGIEKSVAISIIESIKEA